MSEVLVHGSIAAAPRSGAPVRVFEADLSRPYARRRFIRTALQIHADDPNHIAPLWRDEAYVLNPLVSPQQEQVSGQAFLAERGGATVGRLLVFVHHGYDQVRGQGTGWFGFFDCEDDPAAASALFQLGETWLRARGVRRIVGPVNFNLHHQAGVLVKGFDRPPVVGTPYNPPHTPGLLAEVGLRPRCDLFSYWCDLATLCAGPGAERARARVQRTMERGDVRVRAADLVHLEDELAQWHAIVNGSQRGCADATHLSRREFDAMAYDLGRLASERLVLFVEVQGRPVGVVALVPDVHRLQPRNGHLLPFGWLKLLREHKHLPHGRVPPPAVLPEFQSLGLEQVLLVHLAERAHALGLKSCEVACVHQDDHVLNAALRDLGARVDRRYSLFERRLALD